MKLNVNILSNLKTGEAEKILHKRAEEAVKRVVILIAADSIKPPSPFLTGNNRRSMDYEIKGLEGRVFSTSGYGGYLETGTSKMPARPYMKPALDRHIGKLGEFMQEGL